jgi:hypothetical protein
MKTRNKTRNIKKKSRSTKRKSYKYIKQRKIKGEKSRKNLGKQKF